MSTNLYVPIKRIPESALLADYTGIFNDFRVTSQMAKDLDELMHGEPPDWKYGEALTIAILVKYSRPFVSGIRLSLGSADMNSALNAEQLEKHRALREYRDKHIAHSVNSFEESEPVARFWDDRVSTEGIDSIECNHIMVVGLGSSDLADVVELCNVWMAYLDPKINAEKAKLLQLVRALPVAEVLSWDASAPRVNMAKVGKPRHRQR
jgi:hypothetical protein